MINVKAAIRAAAGYVRELYENDAHDIRLEEVLPSLEQNDPWRITLSFELGLRREYKQIEVDPESGKVRAMRIRQLISDPCA